MSDPENTFTIFAVKALFKKINVGEVQFGSVPKTGREIDGVRFDAAGEPIYESIGPLVRALARGVAGTSSNVNRRSGNA
jgi:hypothetical protein